MLWPSHGRGKGVSTLSQLRQSLHAQPITAVCQNRLPTGEGLGGSSPPGLWVAMASCSWPTGLVSARNYSSIGERISEPMRVLICGGGVIGTAIAYFLSRRGVKSTVIERTGLACAASGKSTGATEHPSSSSHAEASRFTLASLKRSAGIAAIDVSRPTLGTPRTTRPATRVAMPTGSIGCRKP
jgi:FAD dependent oxidoreductase